MRKLPDSCDSCEWSKIIEMGGDKSEGGGRRKGDKRERGRRESVRRRRERERESDEGRK